MTEERIGALRDVDGRFLQQTWRHDERQLGPRTVAAIDELKAEGTRCCGGPAPRPAINEEKRVSP